MVFQTRTLTRINRRLNTKQMFLRQLLKVIKGMNSCQSNITITLRIQNRRRGTNRTNIRRNRIITRRQLTVRRQILTTLCRPRRQTMNHLIRQLSHGRHRFRNRTRHELITITSLQLRRHTRRTITSTRVIFGPDLVLLTRVRLTARPHRITSTRAVLSISRRFRLTDYQELNSMNQFHNVDIVLHFIKFGIIRHHIRR